MDEQPTCGRGLAHHARLPQLMGQLMSAVADNLSAHVSGLVLSDVDAQREQRVYEHLAARHREVAATLQGIGTEMAEQARLPMGEHDVQALSSSAATDALQAMIRAEAQLLALVQEFLDEHQAMIDDSHA